MRQGSWMKSSAVALGCACALLLAASGAKAQDPVLRPKKAPDRIALLEQQVDDLKASLRSITGADAPERLREQLTAVQSKVDEISAQLAEARDKLTKGDETDASRDSRLDDASAEVSKLWKQIEELKAELAAVKANPIAGYDNGFFVGSIDGKSRLTLNGLVRPYYRLGLQEVWEKDSLGRLVRVNGVPQGGDLEVDTQEFGLANARLSATVKLFGVLNGKVEIDYGSIAGSLQYPVNSNVDVGDKYGRVKIPQHTLQFLDAYGEYAPFPELKVRVGQYKVPFDLETLISTYRITFTSRSLVTRSYKNYGETVPEDSLTYSWDVESQRASSFGYDRGLQLSGNVANNAFNYATGVFNGGGPETENDNRDFLYVVRLWTEPLGKMSSGMSDTDTAKDPLLSIGAAFAYDLPQHKSLVDPKVTYNSSDINVTGDVLFKWYGVSAMTSIFYRYSDHGDARNRTIGSLGFMVQAAYFNDYTKLEPAVRYALYDADMELDLSHVHEITGGLGYYPFGHNLKIQVEYRGLFPSDTQRTYLLPFGNWYDYRHEITLGGQFSF